MIAAEQAARVLAALSRTPQTLADICDASAPIGIADVADVLVGLCQDHKARGHFDPARGCRVYMKVAS